MSIYSIFCFLLSVQCVASFLVYYTVLSTALNSYQLPPGLPCRALHHSSSQMLLHPLSQHLEIMLYYYFNFTVGYGQTFQWGNEIFTKCRHPRHNTAPSQHSMCCKHGQLPQLAAAKLPRPQNLLSNTEAVRNVQSKTSHEKSGQVDSRHILQNCIFNTLKIPRLGDHFLSL